MEEIDLKQLLDDTERHYVRQALKATHGDVRAAAALLHVSWRTLYRRLHTWGIDRMSEEFVNEIE